MFVPVVEDGRFFVYVHTNDAPAASVFGNVTPGQVNVTALSDWPVWLSTSERLLIVALIPVGIGPLPVGFVTVTVPVTFWFESTGVPFV